MKKLFLALSIFSAINCLQAQSQMKQDVKYLSSDELGGRETGTKGEELAANYVVERMKKIGLSPRGEKEFFQHFSVTPKSNPHATEPEKEAVAINGKNVIGYLDNGAENTIVFGAHFDHLGEGGEGSLSVDKEDIIHNGADDNASGVAMILDLAQKLKTLEVKSHNYLFIAFSGEEKGLWGSNHFAKNPTISLNNVSYMLNFDMVGRFDESKGLAINGVGTSPFWKNSLDSINTNSITLIKGESGVGPSDHTSFYLENIPVLHFFTGQHEDYHKPSDDFSKVNFKGMETISTYVFRLVELASSNSKLEFTKTKDEQKKAARFKVTLGVMPDYMYQEEGMRIDGVLEDRPAQKAGMQKGDVVIKLGEIEVTDMYTYMEALAKFKKGDKAKVFFTREGKKIKKTVIF